VTLISSSSTIAKTDVFGGPEGLDTLAVPDTADVPGMQGTSPVGDVTQLDERCVGAQRFYAERIEAKRGVEFSEDEWRELLDGYNACVDAGVVTEEMKAAVAWAVECAVVAGVNPECPTTKKNPSIPPPPAESKKPQASFAPPQQTQVPRPQEQNNSTKAEYSPPGFWMGGWHGLVWPWRFTASFFTNVDVWADDNVGILYAIGYILGLIFCVPVWVGLVIGIFNRDD